MRVGVVSDVHNNVDALAYALEQLKACDVVVSLGDLISDYRVAPKIIEMAREAGVVGIRGNHEKSILLHPGSRLREQLAAEDLAYFADLPHQRELIADGRRVRLVHGAPWDSPEDYRCHYFSPRDAAAVARLAETDADVVLLGHTHVATSLRTGSVLVLNPGSCGEARDQHQRLSFAELDFGHGVASVYQIGHGVAPEVMLRTEL